VDQVVVERDGGVEWAKGVFHQRELGTPGRVADRLFEDTGMALGLASAGE
jgi:hypothetical protein